ESARAGLDRIPRDAGAYPMLFVCGATGLACAAFGQLLGAPPLAIPPVFLGAAAGQYLRQAMLARKMNLFFMVCLVSFCSSLISGLLARMLGLANLETTAVAAVLLLVPGPAILNAQMDAIDGRPSLAAARALRVVFILLFMTLGFYLSQQMISLF
ncbi:MAG TPA: threonine/serine exporter family protein, partial [Chthoniobacterales bacterium]